MPTARSISRFCLLRSYDCSHLLPHEVRPMLLRTSGRAEDESAMHEVTLKLEHNCPYTAFSKRFPEVLVQHWCSIERDVLLFHRTRETDADDLRRGMRQLEADLGSKFTRVVSANPSSTVVVQKHLYTSMKSNVNMSIERCDCLEVQPTVYRQGYEWYRILAFRQSD